MKKAQGLSINVIIVAAIALIVLVVLVAIFTGRLGLFTEKVQEVGQTCTEHTVELESGTETAGWQTGPCTGDNIREIFTATDADKQVGNHCCIRTK